MRRLRPGQEEKTLPFAGTIEVPVAGTSLQRVRAIEAQIKPLVGRRRYYLRNVRRVKRPQKRRKWEAHLAAADYTIAILRAHLRRSWKEKV